MADDKSETQVLPAVIDYTNHRGERKHRVIIPSAKPFYGSTAWHPEEQWLLEAWDFEKAALRTFALKDVHSWQTPKEATVDASIAKQLQNSMELNARMKNRLSKLAEILEHSDDLARDAMIPVRQILKDEEPTWPPA